MSNQQSAISNPAVSVVIPAYNRAHCILKTLDSVFAQTYTNYEVIIINDGSKDNTDEVLAPYLDRITYIKQENRGLAGTRTRAVELANTEWIAFLDSDDLWLPDNLETHVKVVTADPSLILNTTNSLIFREHIGQETDLFEFNGCRKVYTEEQFALPDPLLPYLRFGLLWMQSALIRKSALVQAGPWIKDLRVWMDFEYGTRLAKLGKWGVTMTPKVRILRQDDGGQVESISSLSGTEKGVRELVRVYELMAQLPKLNPAENAHVARKLSDARSKLGWKLLATTSPAEGRAQLRQSFQARPSFATFVKACVCHLPLPLGGRAIANKFNRS